MPVGKAYWWASLKRRCGDPASAGLEDALVGMWHLVATKVTKVYENAQNGLGRNRDHGFIYLYAISYCVPCHDWGRLVFELLFPA